MRKIFFILFFIFTANLLLAQSPYKIPSNLVVVSGTKKNTFKNGTDSLNLYFSGSNFILDFTKDRRIIFSDSVYYGNNRLLNITDTVSTLATKYYVSTVGVDSSIYATRYYVMTLVGDTAKILHWADTVTSIATKTNIVNDTSHVKTNGDNIYGAIVLHNSFFTQYTNSTSTDRGSYFQQYSTDALGSQINLDKGRGTGLNPTVITSGDTLGRIWFKGYDGSVMRKSASITALSTGTIGTNRVPSILTFNTSTDAAPNVVTEAMRINASQYIGIGNTAPTTFIDAINNTKASGANYFRNTVYNNIPDPPYFICRFSRGTATVPAPVQSTDALGGFLFQGNRGTGTGDFKYGGLIVVEAYASPTATFVPTTMRFGVNDGTTLQTELFIYPNRIGLGAYSTTAVPTYSLSFTGNAAKTVSLERNTTGNTAGNDISISAGGCTSGSTNKGGGMLYFGNYQYTTGTGVTSIRMKSWSRTAASTSDNSAYDRFIVPSEKVLRDATVDTLFFFTPVSGDSIFSALVHYGITATNGTDRQSETGTMLISSVVKTGSLTGVIPSTTVLQAVSGGTLTQTAVAVVWNNTTKIAYVTVNYDSSLNPTSGNMRFAYTLTNTCRATVTQY